MSWTQADLSNLNRAIVTGTKRVTVDGKTVEYRSMEELVAARDMVVRELGLSNSPARKFGTYSKGL
jgi:hypothetical protein